METLETLVIGAGQAGLCAGWHLARHRIGFLILEASPRVGGAWRNYYDSLRLFSPAACSALPGMPFPGAQERYPRRDEVVAYLEEYARRFALPVRTGRKVTRVIRGKDGFEVMTEKGERYLARSIVVASGAFGSPYTPPIEGLQDFKGRVLHSAEYANPGGFEGRRVVVVGGANSAVQIAAELAAVAQVMLASTKPVRFFPQRLAGLDFHFWVKWTGLEKTRWLKDQGTPVLDDGTYRRALESGRVPRRAMFRRMSERGVVWPDGSEEAVDAVLFATGFRPNAPFLHELGVADVRLGLAQRNGIARDCPGLYFLGFPRQRNFASATLRGVGADAAYIMPHLRAYLREARHAGGLCSKGWSRCTADALAWRGGSSS